MKPVLRSAAPIAGEMRRASFSVGTFGKSAVMSSARVDRVGDSIVQAGWDLTEFTANPVMLYEHNRAEPVGIWKNLRIEAGNLTGDPEWHPAEVNPLAGRLQWLYENGKLKAFSVGFVPLEWEPMPDASGWLIKRAKLLECSCVVIPANVDAMMKGLGVLPVYKPFDLAALKASPMPAVANAMRLPLESKATMTEEIKAMIAAEVAKALGSIKDQTTVTQPAAEVADDEADTDSEDDLVAVELAELEADTAETLALIAEIENEAGTAS